MAKMNAHNVATAIIAAAIAFRQKWDADLEAQREDRLLMSKEQQEASAAEVQPEEMDEQDFYLQFVDFLERDGLGKFLKNADSNIKTIAALKKGESAFTLRAQDKTASIVTRVWYDIQAINPDIGGDKLNQCEGTIERMEQYEQQRWAD